VSRGAATRASLTVPLIEQPPGFGARGGR
jgi:hypothetical protein